MNARYPIYIISKGRWERRQTVKTLESMNCPFKIVVEPSEYDNYKEHIDIEKIICLPSNFSELNQGSIPVRNFVWQHSIDAGFEFHWILDDNIESVERFYNNMKIKCICPTPFAVIEDFVNYKDLVNDGGYIIFDDYNDFGWNPVVKHGVDMIVNEYLFDDYEVLGFVYNKLKATPDSMIYNNEFVLRKKIK
jgi:hypothetical protein